jgi:ABC-type dipeptide/oligopeptide/nickel transport system permease subunit
MELTDTRGTLLAAVWRRPAGRAALVTLGLIVAAAVAAPPFLPDPAAQPDVVGQASLPPGPGHPFGTDQLSRDVLARVMFRHLLPNSTGPLLVAATLGVGDVILLEAGLSFLGLGIQPPKPSWGGMIFDAKSVLVTAPWTGIFPGLAIAVTVLAVNLLGDALSGAVDPRQS